jgi:hypothetical protein
MTGSTTGAVIESTSIRLIRAFFYRSAFVFCARRQRNLPNAEQECSAIEASMDPYLAVISYVERLHRQFLEVLKLELEGLGIHDINNVQAMMLFNIGDAEMTVGELTPIMSRRWWKTNIWHTNARCTIAARYTFN